MRLKLYKPEWSDARVTNELIEASSIISDNLWKDAAVEFMAEREIKMKQGKPAPKGMQKHLNSILVKKFNDKGWLGSAGYFYKNKTWVRITFRHQMSIGSDIIDAIKVCKLEKMETAVIIAANRSTLEIITPNDAAAVISFEKLNSEVQGLKNVIDIPLLIGELSKLTSASKEIENELKKERKRDVSTPMV